MAIKGHAVSGKPLNRKTANAKAAARELALDPYSKRAKPRTRTYSTTQKADGRLLSAEAAITKKNTDTADFVKIFLEAPGIGRTGLVISPESPLSNALIAQAVGVARSQPTRWLSNEETPSPQSQARLADLYNVAAQFQMIWPAALLPEWFASSNAHLAGRKPIDVFRIEGGAPLLRAIRADGAGAYA